MQFFWERTSKSVLTRRSGLGEFRSGVSLHSHTMFSEESLEMVPRYTGKVPFLGAAIRRQEAEYSAKASSPFDFNRAFWTPPLTPRQAYRLEEKQIQRLLQLSPLVSLTDHDDTRAAPLLRVMNRFRYAPISTEWTIPFEPTFFHLGIHNLPAEHARELQSQMASYTSGSASGQLTNCLERLNSYPHVLVVLNHPLWDEKGIGSVPHRAALSLLLEKHRRHIHAVEVNGLRSWVENQAVISLGRTLGLPVVSGGDRHGREPNAILNLSPAGSFNEFVEEVRYRRKSHVIFMPQYREPLRLRILQTMVDVLRDYPENVEGRRSWSDRVFFRDPQGNTTPLTHIWKDGGPKIIREFIRVMRLLEWRGLQSALRIALDDRSSKWWEGEAPV